MRKSAFITGCNSVLGVAIARKLLLADYDIIAHYHKSKARLRGLATEFPEKKIHIIQGEFDKAGVLEMLAQVKIISTPIKVLVNNAATVTKEADLCDLDWDTLSKTFEVNVFSSALIAATVFEWMKVGGGKIINISSVGAKYGGGNTTLHYGMSKAALDALTMNLARQGAPYKILVNSVRPGLIDTDFHAMRTPKKNMIERLKRNPLKRMASPEENCGYGKFFSFRKW